MAKKEFTHNEAVAMMHRHLAENLVRLADYIQKWELSPERTVTLLKEMADGCEEVAIDVDMIDSKGYKVTDKGQSGTFMVTG